MLSALELEALKLSAFIAIIAVSASIIPGIIIAWIISKKNGFLASILNILVYLPLVLPPVVIGYLLLLLFSHNGVIGNFLYENFNISVNFSWKGAAIAAAVVSFPLLVRSIKLGFDTFDSKIEEAAYMNGASKIDCFFSITLPQVLPSIITGLTLAFARCLAEFGATITFVSNIPGETQTLPLALYTATQIPGTDQAALRLVLISIALAFISVAIAEILAKRANKRIMGNPN
ncbi:MAG: molybdate ABC transporter permease subunit [Alphaproteobacteria bacterium]|nr:molybdate ABC transporter permease subunit [Alphaproteobacteria bacterium]